MIVTDTMIWYNLPPQLRKTKLLGLKSTYVNIVELNSTNNLKNKPLIVKKAVGNLISNSFDIELLHPIDYLIFLSNNVRPSLEYQYSVLADM